MWLQKPVKMQSYLSAPMNVQWRDCKSTVIITTGNQIVSTFAFGNTSGNTDEELLTHYIGR